MEKLQRNTVFVLGAGASQPYGYPTGRQLLQKIVEGSLGANTTLDCDEYREFKEALALAPDQSVDAFLEGRRDLNSIGKRAIAEWLIRCENPTGLGRRNDGKDWYRHFFADQFAGLAAEQIPGLPFAFITFNYDRSLQSALFNFVKGRYGKVDDVTGGLCQTVEIYHVHGCLDALPWDRRRGIPTREYSMKITPEIVRRAADQIKIIHDGDSETEELKQARKRLSTAERVYFLGFGYHRENLRRLHHGHSWRPDVKMSGSAFRDDRNRIEIRLSRVGDGFPKVGVREPSDTIIDFLEGLQDY